MAVRNIRFSLQLPSTGAMLFSRYREFRRYHNTHKGQQLRIWFLNSGASKHVIIIKIKFLIFNSKTVLYFTVYGKVM